MPVEARSVATPDGVPAGSDSEPVLEYEKTAPVPPLYSFIDQFLAYYVDCDEEPPEHIIGLLRSQQCMQGKLVLRGASFNPTSILALNHCILTSSQNLVTLDLSDCNIRDEGAILLISELKKYQRSQWKLELKGNGLTSGCCKVLADLVHVNQQLTKLSLRWNDMGIDTDMFLVFCDNLAFNQGLRKLDLRSNCITTVGCRHLINSLKMNSDLICLDLRYNSITTSGGNLISDLLKMNTSLEVVLLDGNGISVDIQELILARTKCNRDRKNLAMTSDKMVSAVSLELKKVRSMSDAEVKKLEHELTMKQVLMNEQIRSFTKKENILLEEIENKTTAANVAESRLSQMTSEIVVNKNAINELQRKLDIAYKENEHQKLQFENDLEVKRKENQLLHAHVATLKETQSSNERTNEQTVASLRRELGEQHVSVQSLHERISILKAENDLSRVTSQKEIDDLIRQHRIEIGEVEKRAQQRVEAALVESEAINKNLHAQISRLQADQANNDERVNSLLSQITQVKVQCHDEVLTERQRVIKQSEADRRQLEDRLEETRKDLDAKCHEIAELNQKLDVAQRCEETAKNQLEIVERLRENLKQELADRQAAVNDATSSIRGEINDWKRLYDQEKETSKKLREELDSSDEVHRQKHTMLCKEIEQRDATTVELRKLVAQKDSMLEAIVAQETRKKDILASTLDSLFPLSHNNSERHVLDEAALGGTLDSSLGMPTDRPGSAAQQHKGDGVE